MAGVGWTETAPAALASALGWVEDEVHGVGIVGEQEGKQKENDTSETQNRHAHTIQLYVKYSKLLTRTRMCAARKRRRGRVWIWRVRHLFLRLLACVPHPHL